jgi:hypothetical protein
MTTGQKKITIYVFERLPDRLGILESSYLMFGGEDDA